MKTVLKFLLFAPLAAAALLTCGDDMPLSENDPDFTGDYRLVPQQPDTSSLLAFNTVSLAFTQGKNKYASVAVSTDSSGLVDSTYAALHQTATSIDLLLLRPGNGKLFLIGRRPNGKSDTVGPLSLTIRSPFTIIGPDMVFRGDTLRFTLDTIRGGGAARKRVTWVIWTDSETFGGDTLRLERPYLLPLRDSLEHTIIAQCVDAEGNRFIADTATIAAKGNRPRIDTILVSPVNPQVRRAFSLTVRIRSFVGDSGTVIAVCGRDTVRSTIAFPSRVNEEKTLTFTSGALDTGTISITARYTSARSVGVYAEKATTVRITVIPPRVTFERDTMIVATGQNVSLRLIGTAYRYVWQFGTSRLDTTAQPSRDTVLFPDSAAPLRVVAFGIDSLGYAGPRDTMIVMARNFPYILEFVEKPRRDTLTVLDTALWKVRTSALTGESPRGAYDWIVTSAKGDTLLKLLSSPADSLTLPLRTLMGTMFCSVTFKDSAGRRSNQLTDQRTVVDVRPVIDSIGILPAIVFTRTTVTITVAARPGARGIPIKKYLWSWNGDTTAWTDSTTAASISRSFSDAGEYTVVARCVDSLGFASGISKRTIIVIGTAPVIDSISVPSPAYARQPVVISVSGRSGQTGARIVKYYWSWTGNPVWTDSSSTPSISHTFANPGSYTVLARCVDSLGASSSSVSRAVTIQSAAPLIDSIAVPAAIYNRTAVTVTAVARKGPTGASIVRYYWSWTGDTLWTDSTTSSSISHTFANPGSYTVLARCVDSVGFPSNVVSRQVTVQNAAPQIDSIAVPAAIYNRAAVTLTAVARKGPTGASIVRYYWSWTGDTLWTDSTTSPSISHTFANPGSYTVLARCVDSLGASSTTASRVVTVQNGAPLIDSITVADPATLFVRKPFTVRVFARSPASSAIDSFALILTKGADTMRLRSGGSQIAVTADTSQWGVWKIAAQCKDAQGRWSTLDTAKSRYTIRRGAPVITAVVQSDTAWYRDTVHFGVSYNDTDGIVVRVRVEWGDGTADSVAPQRQQGTAAFAHRYTTGTISPLRIIATDDNGIKSTAYQKTVTVHMGVPVIRPRETRFYPVLGTFNDTLKDTLQTVISGDTLLMPYVLGFRWYNNKLLFSCQASDSNGSVVRRVLDTAAPFGMTSADTVSLPKDTLTLVIPNYYGNKFNSDSPAVRAVLYCVDDDSLVGADTFFIRSMRPPTYPWISDGSPSWDDTLRDSIVYLYWEGGEDYVDRQQVDVTLAYYGGCDPNTGTCADSAIVWQGKLSACYSVSMQRFERQFTVPSRFTPGPNHRISVKVKNRVGFTASTYKEFYYKKYW